MTSDRINIMAIAREFPRLWESSTALELFAFARKCIEADREACIDIPGVDLIMQQAQVLASAWSLVGGEFDGGDMLEVVEAERTSLRKMIEAIASLIAKPRVRIKQWSVKTEPFPHITGVAAGHPVLGDGPVRTSKLVSIETHNTVYVLVGEPECAPRAKSDAAQLTSDELGELRLLIAFCESHLVAPHIERGSNVDNALRTLRSRVAEIERLDRANARGESKRELA